MKVNEQTKQQIGGDRQPYHPEVHSTYQTKLSFYKKVDTVLTSLKTFQVLLQAQERYYNL